MNWLRPLKLWLFSLIGRPRCDSCGDQRATAVRVMGGVEWLVCCCCAAAIDADPPIYDLLEDAQ